MRRAAAFLAFIASANFSLVGGNLACGASTVMDGHAAAPSATAAGRAPARGAHGAHEAHASAGMSGAPDASDLPHDVPPCGDAAPGDCCRAVTSCAAAFAVAGEMPRTVAPVSDVRAAGTGEHPPASAVSVPDPPPPRG